MAHISYKAAYPGIQFLPRSHNWWAWLKGTPAECIHLDREAAWIATLLPDTLYFCGKRSALREPARPEVSLCRACLLDTVAGELREYSGRVVAFEPDSEVFTQYFFVGAQDFEKAGLLPDVAAAIQKRLEQNGIGCTACARAATWLWLSRERVTSLSDAGQISSVAGEPLCAAHGASKLCKAFEHIAEANVFYMNLPYGEAGAYVWI